MTTPRYPNGCAAGSQVRGDAGSSRSVWIVNFNNGNVNNNDRNNRAFARPCRVAAPAGECQGEVSLQQLYAAWRGARRKKRPSANQLSFDLRSIDRMLVLQQQINAVSWAPAPATCFIAQRPKARQIHAPDFGDRVVHHWLVPQLEAIYEPGFIHDSYANRKGKGSHAAVRCLQGFVRQVHSGQGGGWYLQLDIQNFFNSIHRPTLWAMLKERLERASLGEIALKAVHALLRHPVQYQGVVHRSTPAERAQVPAHKRLENAAPGCGLPIGNLSSQFFANVYLDVLDQFVKHQLKAKRYLRYVDDFVLVHRDRAVLESWQREIEQFLAERLQLRLKADIRLRPLSSGIDFLGYIIFPTHTLVRRRVLQHARDAFRAWGQRHIRAGNAIGTPADIRQLRSQAASYDGHMQHANSHRLKQRLAQEFPWLESLTDHPIRFHHRLEGRQLSIGVRK